jgi:drug/metabolite transporter (DMT)-like permease
MKDKTFHIGFIHLAVLLFGLSGIFAKVIPYSALLIVLGRVFFAAIFLGIVLFLLKLSFRLGSRKDILVFFLIGVVLAVHWSSFFYSIQVSSVAVGLITFATFPVFSVFLEPIIFKEPVRRQNIVIAFITFSGVILIVQDFSFNNTIFIGAIWGIVSALTFAILSILNRKLVKGYSSIVIGFYQNSFAFIVLLPVLFFIPLQIQLHNLLLLILLGVIFTGFSHVIFIQGLKSVNVQRASVIACLEPVYGIVAAIYILAEVPSLREVIGISIILSMAIYVTVKK